MDSALSTIATIKTLSWIYRNPITTMGLGAICLGGGTVFILKAVDLVIMHKEILAVLWELDNNLQLFRDVNSHHFIDPTHIYRIVQILQHTLPQFHRFQIIAFLKVKLMRGQYQWKGFELYDQMFPTPLFFTRIPDGDLYIKNQGLIQQDPVIDDDLDSLDSSDDPDAQVDPDAKAALVAYAESIAIRVAKNSEKLVNDAEAYETVTNAMGISW